MARRLVIGAANATAEVKVTIQTGQVEVRIGLGSRSGDYVSLVGTRAEVAEFVEELRHVVGRPTHN